MRCAEPIPYAAPVLCPGVVSQPLPTTWYALSHIAKVFCSYLPLLGWVVSDCYKANPQKMEQLDSSTEPSPANIRAVSRKLLFCSRPSHLSRNGGAKGARTSCSGVRQQTLLWPWLH